VVFGKLLITIIYILIHLFFFIVGRVIEGMLVVRKIENVPVALNNKPKIPVIISQCGEM
jgi:cyclophilin family peptidyl-prolyl cis-trans isomerase